MLNETGVVTSCGSRAECGADGGESMKWQRTVGLLCDQFYRSVGVKLLSSVCLSQLLGGDSVQPDPRPEGLPLLRRARLQGHVRPHAPPRPAVHLAVQHARGEQLAVGRGRLGDQSLRPNATHVHVLPGLGRLQLHLQRDAVGQRRDGECCWLILIHVQILLHNSPDRKLEN